MQLTCQLVYANLAKYLKILGKTGYPNLKIVISEARQGYTKLDRKISKKSPKSGNESKFNIPQNLTFDKKFLEYFKVKFL